MRLIKVKLHLYKTKLMNGNFWSRVQALGPGEKKNECGVTKLAEERSSRCGVRVDFNSFPSQILHGFNQLHLLQSLAPVTKNDPERKLLKSLSKFPPFQKSNKARSTKSTFNSTVFVSGTNSTVLVEPTVQFFFVRRLCWLLGFILRN